MFFSNIHHAHAQTQGSNDLPKLQSQVHSNQALLSPPIGSQNYSSIIRVSFTKHASTSSTKPPNFSRFSRLSQISDAAQAPNPHRPTHRSPPAHHRFLLPATQCHGACRSMKMPTSPSQRCAALLAGDEAGAERDAPRRCQREAAERNAASGA